MGGRRWIVAAVLVLLLLVGGAFVLIALTQDEGGSDAPGDPSGASVTQGGAITATA
ncbi:hypothetical protein RDV89_13015 [Nocardioides zeae]|uniref:Uncharacterized protein n=1 Tax=Nocardioides imazamoxiresistens TaxID=3231893 RepID=A0ABU3PXM8_9ACTN|nr:hypothetical protein [Nocardioides zeae]MDT9593996.1 hypothetical protein [Nocardioides zeae]